MRDAIAECLAAGLTGIHEMGATLFAIASYRRLIGRGQFPFRNYAAVAGRSEETWAHYRERGPEVIGDGQVTVGAFKLLSDGALGSRGAALHSPYCDDPENRGLLLIPHDELERLAREAMALGFQVCVHAIGDRANTLTLDTFERALVDHPEARALRPRVEHAQILAEADIPRFRRLGVLPSMQPTHCTSDMPWAAERLGPERLARRLRLALDPRQRGHHRRRLGLPGREPEPVLGHLCRGGPAAAHRRAPRLAARAAHDARGSGACLHGVERLRVAPGTRSRASSPPAGAPTSSSAPTTCSPVRRSGSRTSRRS